MATADLGGELRAEQSQLLALWRANMRRETLSGTAHRCEENQLWKLGCSQPGEATAIVNPTKCQAPIAINTVPTKLGCLESLAAHGLHRVPEERLDRTNLRSHVHAVRPTITRSAAARKCPPLQHVAGQRCHETICLRPWV
jgi:hypothetical protein